ncbi:uncharacterized protein LOC117824015 isoform X3 [Notolabrus celidotus]|uniref:uncharacterized protein LOC117824015 isoform X3 n=1 Tax=Notolabrus celidotus TaxID=1203425 RepID=UPI00148FB23E|nr:uncharacterized protein LOC117824015 isoform X3 [Notolabrus celidotus]
MKTVAAVIIGLIFAFSDFIETTAGSQLQEPVIQMECRDRYLWVHVTSTKTPRFEALDGNGVHSISEQVASLCGYTISSFKMDGSTTFRASYYSCFTQNQNDEVFTFRLNVMVNDAGGSRISRPVSVVCSGLIWTHREVACEEDYMEVNVNRDSSCGGLRGDSGPEWQAALAQAQRTASSAWQLMILKSDGQVSSMSISEAQRQGFSLSTSAQRIVLRSGYKQPHAELTMVDGIPVEVVRASLYSKQKLTVLMIDASMACTVNPGSFDGSQLLWDVPLLMSPLTGEGVGFESRNLSVGIEGVLLDKPTATTRGFSMLQQGNVVQIRVPFGTKGGYRKSLVVNNLYKETYVIYLLYEHVFSLLFEDGSSIDTKHRMLRVLDTPLLCRPPFSLDQTMNDDQAFRVYLGNIPADVILEEVQINGQQLMSQSAKRGLSINSVVNTNGSQGYELQLPFEDAAVHWTYLGQGEVQYSIGINFTLTIMPQRQSYYHHTSLTARVSNTFPPEITAQCSERGISFSVVRPPQTESFWEVGVNQEPLTSELADQRGYRLNSDTSRTALEVPVFSVGYTYEDINLSNFYGTFQLLLRDSKTLEVQTSTSKHCLFKTQDMIVCSRDGTMTVVTTPTSTWPTVLPERTTLLDPTCRPKQTDGSRVLFEFKLNSCGTRATVGESYVVYENEILHDRQMIADGPNLIFRESQFKLTVRCFYPLSAVNRLSVDRTFRSHTPGFGSVKVFKSLKDPDDQISSQDCSHQGSGPATHTPTNQVHQTPEAESVLPQRTVMPLPKPGPSNFITVPAGRNKLLYSLQNLKLLPPLEAPLRVPSGNVLVQTKDPPRYGTSPASSVQLSNLNTQSLSLGEERQENSRLTKDHQGSGLDQNVWPSSLAWFRPTQNRFVQNSLGLQNLNFAPGRQDLNKPNVAYLDVDLYRHTTGGQEVAKTEEVPGYQPQRPYDLSQATLFHPVLEPVAQYSPENTGSNDPPQSSRNKKYVPADAKTTTSKCTITDSKSRDKERSVLSSQSTSPINQSPGRPGSIDRRNTETVWSRVQNIRVKPQSKFVSSGLSVNQKPETQQANPRVSDNSQYATGLNTDRSDGNHWTQRLPDQRGSSVREGRVPDRTQTQEVVPNRPRHQQEVVHPVPNQTGHQQELVQNRPRHQQEVVHPVPNRPLHQQEVVPNQPQHQQEVVHPVPNQPQHQQEVVHPVPNQPRHQQEVVHPVPNQPQHQQEVVHPVPNQPRHQQEVVHPVPNQPRHQQEVVHPVPNQPRHQQEVVHPVPNQPRHRQEVVLPVPNQPGSKRTIIQPPGASHIRVRPVFGLQERSLTSLGPKQQNPSPQTDTRGGTHRNPIPASTPQDTPANIRDQPHNPNRQSERNPAAGTAGITVSSSGYNGSGSEPKIHTGSDCSRFSQYGTSVHQGIMRGKQIGR